MEDFHVFRLNTDYPDIDDVPDIALVKLCKEYKLEYGQFYGEIRLDKEFLARWWDHIHEALDNFQEIVHCYNNGTIAHRYLFVNHENDVDKIDLGMHWTTDPSFIDDYELDALGEHVVGKKYMVEIIARIPPKTISVHVSILQRIEYPQEQELFVPQEKVGNIKLMSVNLERNRYRGDEEDFEEVEDEETRYE